MTQVWRVVCLAALSLFSADVVAARVVSLNTCFDEWAPQWLPSSWEFIASSVHGNRLERVLAAQPDYVLYGTYTNARLVRELQQATTAVHVVEPNTWSQWQEALRALGTELALETEINQWAIGQQQAMNKPVAAKQQILVVMPNQYSWGGASFIVNMLRQHGVSVMVKDEHLSLVQISLEQLIQLNPQRVILDGFSSDYARANDWLWHSALRPWLNARQVVQIDTDLSSCPAQRAHEYLTKVVGQP